MSSPATRFHNSENRDGRGVRDTEASIAHLRCWLQEKRGLQVVGVHNDNRTNNCLFTSLSKCLEDDVVVDSMSKTLHPSALPNAETLRQRAVDYVEDIIQQGHAHVSGLFLDVYTHIIFEVGDGNDAEFDGLFQSWCDNMRMNAMADSIILQALCARYGITAYVWQPPLQCIMRTLKRSSNLQPIVFHPQGGRTSTNAYMTLCNLHFEPLHATKKINYRAPRNDILNGLSALRANNIDVATRTRIQSNTARLGMRNAFVQKCLVPTSDSSPIIDAVVSLTVALRKADIDKATVDKCSEWFESMCTDKHFEEAVLCLERGDAQYQLHIQGAANVKLEGPDFTELKEHWREWAHFECDIPVGQSYNVHVDLRPVNKKNTFQFLAGYCMKQQQRIRYRIPFMSNGISVEWLFEAKQMHARIQEGSPYKKKTTLVLTNIGQHMDEFEHRHLWPLQVTLAQLLRFMVLSGYYIMSPRFASIGGKIHYANMEAHRRVLRGMRERGDCDVMDFHHLIAYSNDRWENNPIHGNPLYDTCTLEEGKRFANAERQAQDDDVDVSQLRDEDIYVHDNTGDASLRRRDIDEEDADDHGTEDDVAANDDDMSQDDA